MRSIRTRFPQLAMASLALVLGDSACGVEMPPALDAVVPVVGPCEGCEAAFDAMPAVVVSHLQLAAADEPGERLQLSGYIRDGAGDPLAGIVLYVYQTDHEGLYPRADASLGYEARRHGRLRGWVRSDANGRYRIDTIRPGSYPGEDIPQHIHLHVIEPGCATYFIDDVMFRDDPKLAQSAEQASTRGIGGSGIVQPHRDNGIWQVRRDVIVGRNVPGYPSCGRG